MEGMSWRSEPRECGRQRQRRIRNLNAKRDEYQLLPCKFQEPVGRKHQHEAIQIHSTD
jgi:hypothetical protein